MATIFEACQHGDISTVEAWLSRNPNVNEKNGAGQTPLFLACAHEQEIIVKKLLEIPDIDVNTRDNPGNTAFSIACNRKHLNIALLLASDSRFDAVNRNQKGQISLHFAAEVGFAEVINTLREKHPTSLATGINSRTDKLGYTALHIASMSGDENTAKELLKFDNINPNLTDSSKDEKTAMDYAILMGQIGIVKLFLLHPKINFTIDAKAKELAGTISEMRYEEDRNSQNAYLDILKLFDDIAILHQACLDNDAINIRFFLDYYPEFVNYSLNKNGNTALHIAVIMDRVEAVKAIVQNNYPVDFQRKDNNGRTAWDYGSVRTDQNEAQEEIYQILRNIYEPPPAYAPTSEPLQGSIPS